MPRGTQDPASVRHAFAYGALTLYGRASHRARLTWYRPTYAVLQPPCASLRTGLGSSPFARHYSGNALLSLFLRVHEMFQFPAFPCAPYVFRCAYRSITRGGFPHSDIPGSRPVCGSPRLFAAYHVLHRLPAPRHPPYALRSLTNYLSFYALPLYQPSSGLLFTCFSSLPFARVFLPFASLFLYVFFLYAVAKEHCPGCLLRVTRAKFGGDDRTRTDDPLRAKQVLSQLSYIPIFTHLNFRG